MIRVANFKPVQVNDTNEAADSLDWRDKGVVCQVKYQSPCGSFSASSTMDNLEYLYAKIKGILT